MTSVQLRLRRLATIAGLFLLTLLAVLVHGYHLGADDAAVYVPGIKMAADPTLYPFDSEFFMSHARLSVFAGVVGGSARLTGLPPDTVIFLWHIAGVCMLLAAAWRLLSVCYESRYARWSGVALLAAVLVVPVANTGLLIMDPNLTPRTLSTPATLFAVGCFLRKEYRGGVAWLLITALFHPQMSLYAAMVPACLLLVRRLSESPARSPALAFSFLPIAQLPLLFDFQPVRGAAREALLTRSYIFVSTWAWYEWLGVFAPLALLWWFSSVSPRGTTPVFRLVARSLVPFGLLFTVAGVALSSSPRLENLARLQPMRAFHLIYVIFFLLLGGLIGEYVLKNRAWRWVALFAPLAASMWLVQRATYPSSRHVEWPGAVDRNPWISAFLWIRANTPKDAVFALDPRYMLLSGEDLHGFRAIAERSALADRVKDDGAVCLFPRLAGEWEQQVQAQDGWVRFKSADFEELAKRYPVTWIVAQNGQSSNLDCPYREAGLEVCQVGAGHPAHAAHLASLTAR
ncbi:MAG TPA: hypothetical protein VN893_04620 [Bryobacteraceae bacterium]|nr:hypothetical protein [Bryobacteraceae bacterium]